MENGFNDYILHNSTGPLLSWGVGVRGRRINLGAQVKSRQGKWPPPLDGPADRLGVRVRVLGIISDLCCNLVIIQARETNEKLLCFTDILNLIATFHAAPTCSALKQKVPSLTSGKYHLRLEDAALSSSQLVQVYCDMSSKNGVGVTVIGHDSESRTLVKGYERPGSYKRKITYDISMEQIVAIMKQSKNCEQFIKYECRHSLFTYRSVSYGWWVSRSGSKMNYWGGAAVDSGKCACGMTNTCAGGGNCNCDKNDLTRREDSGYLTDKNTLPVSELRFGDTGENTPQKKESGYHTLGELRCWD